MEHDWDVVVVGGGIAGCMTATTIASRAKDLRVILLDRNPRSEVGKKNTLGWVCGDAVGEHHTRYVNQRLGITYGHPEIENRVNAVLVFSPDGEVKLPFEGPGYVLDRPKFGTRLLEDALKAGAEFMDNVQAVDLTAEDGYVRGVVCQRTGGSGEPGFKLTARLVVDASGMATKLRRTLPIPSFIEKEIDRDDIEPTARVNAILGEGNEVDPTHCDIYLDQEKAPGGYLWVFPKSRDKVNVGLGIQQKRSKKPLKMLLDEWLRETPLFRGMRPLSDDSNLTGSWQVSVRHQNDCLVANGYMITGDAAWFPNPISAGGIGPALIGGIIAGETAARALHEGDLSEQNLWEYNANYVNKYGKKTAALKAFRVYLQSLNNSEINYGMRHFISHDEAVALSTGDIPHTTFADRLAKAIRGIRKPSAFRGLVYTVRQMAELNNLYEDYPEHPSKFREWKRKVDKVLGDVRQRFGG